MMMIKSPKQTKLSISIAVPVGLLLVFVFWSTLTSSSRRSTAAATGALKPVAVHDAKKSAHTPSARQSRPFVAPKPFPNSPLEPQPVPYQSLLTIDPTLSVSPYEYRWRGARQPWFTQKLKQKVPQVVIPGDHICFVHIGKTAGSTIGCALGFILHCGDATTPLQVLPGNLPQRTTKLIHNDANDCADDMPNYLFVVRNPIARVQSAYPYDRPNYLQEPNAEPQLWQLYTGCRFWTLNDLINQGLDSEGAASDSCKAMAFHTIRGNEYHGNHLYYNYQYYLNQINQGNSGKMWVIRTEHMVGDWNEIEQMLEPTTFQATTDDFAAKNVGAKTAADDQPLSANAKHLLCYALCREIQAYKNILRRAVNLTPSQVEESLQDLYESCPDQAYVDACEFP